MIEFDLVLDRIGHLGRYQILLCGMMYWIGIPTGVHNIASVFYAAPVSYRCSVPPLDNATAYPGLSESDILNFTTPNDGSYDTCHRYGYNLSSCQPPSTSCVDMTAPPTGCDMGYEYDTSQFTSTVNTEWDLVCDRKILDTTATSIFFVGMWAGSVVFGHLADYIGRRDTVLVASIGCLISGISTAFAPWFELFVVLRFFTAAFAIGGNLIMFVYVVEITGNKRTATGVHSHTAFAIGYAINSLVAYFLRDWRQFYFVISLSPIPYFFFYFFIPQSPRWHFSNGREEKGKKIAERFARHNKKIITEKDWKNAEVADAGLEIMERTYTSLDLFRTKGMRLVALNTMFVWLVISMVYYGLSLNAGALAGDIFLNNALNGVLEISGYIFVQLTMNRLGRRVLLVGMMVLQGTACLISTILTALADENQAMITAGVVFAFIGKVGVASSFAIIYNYTAELFPTVVRGNAIGVGSMAARVGSVACPYIILLQDYVSWLPTTIFGTLSVVAGFAALTFPETMNRGMLQTIQEAELFYKGKSSASLENKEELIGEINGAFKSTQL